MDISLSQVLVNAGSSDPNVQKPAEQQLEALKNQNWPAYLTLVCEALADQRHHVSARQLAGLLLKNAITSHDESVQIKLGERWLMLDASVRQSMQQMLLRTLADPFPAARNTAALAVGKIAGVELTKNMWTDLIDILVNNITNGESNGLKQASFLALGYVCEECPHVLQPKSNLILNAIAQGMYKDQADNDIKLAATKALSNALEFTRENFSRKNERAMIMSMVFDATQSPDERVRIEAFNCLVEIASAYYDLIEEFIGDIFRLTCKALSTHLASLSNPQQQGESEGVALQAIEFWSTICEEERNRNEDSEEAVAKGLPVASPSRKYADRALQYFTPLLLQALTNQSEDVDDETWNIAMAAATSLELFAGASGDNVIQYVIPFISQNLSNQNWRFREAATMAFGCILEGPSKAQLSLKAAGALPGILHFLTQDPSPVVKDTAAWTVGKICDVLPETIDETNLPLLMVSLIKALDDEPSLASHVCWAIHNLGSAIVLDDDAPTSPLSPYFQDLASKLLQCTLREDAADTKLLHSAYEALGVLVSSAAMDSFTTIEQMIAPLMQRLKNTMINQGLTGQEREKQNEIQGYLCGTLQCIVTKLDANVTRKYANDFMWVLQNVLKSHHATVHEEALMVIGAIATKIENDFVGYLDNLKPVLMTGLRNFTEYQVCIVSTGVIGDLCRAVGKNMLPYCNEIMWQLLNNLQNPDAERSIKAHVISTIGDIALAIGGDFKAYYQHVMTLLGSASSISLPPEQLSLDTVEYLNDLRANIFEAYTSIVQGMSDGGVVNLLENYINNILAFIQLIVQDPHTDEKVVLYAIGLVGDIANTMGSKVTQQFKCPAVERLFQAASQSQNESIRSQLEWSRNTVQHVLGLGH